MLDVNLRKLKQNKNIFMVWSIGIIIGMPTRFAVSSIVTFYWFLIDCFFFSFSITVHVVFYYGKNGQLQPCFYIVYIFVWK